MDLIGSMWGSGNNSERMQKLIPILTLAFPCLAAGQTYTLRQSEIGRSGFASSSGRYRLVQVERQAHGAIASGGRFTVAGGFGGIVLVQSSDAPLLSIRLFGQTNILTWPVNASGTFILEETSSLASPVQWRTSTVPVTTSNTTAQAILPAQSGGFYRLRRLPD